MIESNDELITRKVAESLDFILDPTREPIKRKHNMPASIKKKIQSSHGKSCPLCRIKMVHTPGKGPGKQKGNEATWEHVLDLTLGGKNGLENAAVICDSCNSANNSVMLEYIGQFGESFGGLEWKEAFNKDRRNLVRLHRFLEWKINSILLSRVDSNLELNEIWSRFRWGETRSLLDTPRRQTDGRGVLNSLFNRIISLFRRSNQTEIAQPSNQTEIAQSPNQKGPTRKMKMQKRQDEIKIRAKREASEIIERITGRKPPSTTIMPEEPTAPSDNQEMRWTDLDKGSLDDLGKLLVHLIGPGRMIMSVLGSEIAKFQSRNNLSGSGSKALFREFGITVTSKTTLKGVIVENFSSLIHVEQVSPVQCFYSVVDKQDL